MAASSPGGPNSNAAFDDAIYLTDAGRRRLEDRLNGDLAERDRLSSIDPTEVRDSADEADRLEAADGLAQLGERIASTRALLEAALPVPSGPDDGVIRLGSTAEIRDRGGDMDLFTFVHPAEVLRDDQSVPVDSPVGRALLGRKVGEQVTVKTPGGDRTFEILKVHPYKPT